MEVLLIFGYIVMNFLAHWLFYRHIDKMKAFLQKRARDPKIA